MGTSLTLIYKQQLQQNNKKPPRLLPSPGDYLQYVDRAVTIPGVTHNMSSLCQFTLATTGGD